MTLGQTARHASRDLDIGQLSPATKPACRYPLTWVLPNRNVKVRPHSSPGMTPFQVWFSLIPRTDKEPLTQSTVSPPITAGAS